MSVHAFQSFSRFSHIAASTGAARNVLMPPHLDNQASHSRVFRVLWYPRQGWFGRDLKNMCPSANRLR
jgi:hypothetical protein